MSDARPDNSAPALTTGRAGDDANGRDVLPLVYSELRALAAGQLRRERSDHTLQPTALVHEVYLKLARDNGVCCRDRAHFLGLAARAMRHILVDHARSRKRVKRGGHARKLSLHELALPSPVGDVDILELDETLESLAVEDSRSAEVVQMRFFGGLTNAEIADVLGVTPRTVERDWRYARAWLARALAVAGTRSGTN